MVPVIIAIVVLAVVGGFLLMKRGAGIGPMLQKAIQDDDIQPLVDHANTLSGPVRSSFYQDVIGQLWDSWNRPLATRLIREFALKHSDERICQYWLKQALEVEPLAAQRWFDEEFVKRHFRPDVAKSCGRTGG